MKAALNFVHEISGESKARTKLFCSTDAARFNLIAGHSIVAVLPAVSFLGDDRILADRFLSVSRSKSAGFYLALIAPKWVNWPSLIQPRL
jgi:hypothetical protein